VYGAVPPVTVVFGLEPEVLTLPDAANPPALPETLLAVTDMSDVP